MSRRCGACRQPIRHDESLSTCYLEGHGGTGYYAACPRCCARAEGVDPPPPRKYPADQIDDPRGVPFAICGLCREAMFAGEYHHQIRLHADDIAALEGHPEVQPGLYAVCPRCWSAWSPVVMARWVREEVIAPGVCPGDLP